MRRDKEAVRNLKKSGWHVLVIWECEINEVKLTALAHEITNTNGDR